MVKKIIIIGLVLFAAFNIFLYLIPKDKGVIYTDIEKTELFLYSGHKYKVVTAGSSLIGRFTLKAKTNKNYFNLSLPPSGGCSGVKIIKLSNKIPDTLYLETNYISRGYNKPLIAHTFEPTSHYPKSYFPALQEKNKFFPFFINYLKPGNMDLPSKKRPQGKLFDKLFAKTKEEYSKALNPKEWNAILKELKEDLNYLTAKGCVVVFFEVPLEKEFRNAPKFTFERKSLKAFFNDSKYKWMPPDTTQTYYTGDGKHLLQESFIQFDEYFSHQASMLKQ
ncbi:hypothetical protein [Pedobacter metabolipauper]|uniref:Uncharacterized protein n=1 Tax=Pedobacter metabolipauper TaxID=425513 RepID=A0A4R6SX54_9SPHI|nr:hypothetical protein [Pedobacter metabolipauper]TDQ10006.1 hypothetical protein ATK78_2165 [Pedobacter metabolipauper]